jgi:hypothetical protein
LIGSDGLGNGGMFYSSTAAVLPWSGKVLKSRSVMEGSDPNSEVTPATGSYFDRVLDRCRSYKQSLDQLLVEVDQEIETIVSEGAEPNAHEAVSATPLSEADNPAFIGPAGGVPAQTDPASLAGTVNRKEGVVETVLDQRNDRQAMVGREARALASILTTAYVLNGRYELVKTMATSGCGMLFKALDRRKLLFDESSPYVAIEVLSNDFQRLPAWQSQLQREATRLSILKHANILRTIDFQRDGATVYVIMEYSRGVALQDKLQHAGAGRLSHKEASKIMLDIGHALMHAHDNGVTHGNLQPANILVSPDGAAQVFDFGVGGLLSATHWQSDDYADLAYLSPDLNEVTGPDACDDVYSYACICHLLLTGTHPFDWRDGKTAARLGLAVPRRLEFSWVQWKALQRALSFDRNKRTPTIAQLVSELTSLNFNPLTLSRIAGRAGLGWLFKRERQTPAQGSVAAAALEHKTEQADIANATDPTSTS